MLMSMPWMSIFMLIWNNKHQAIWTQLLSCNFLKISLSNRTILCGPFSVRPKRRQHITQAQSSVRSSNPLSSVSYVPSHSLDPDSAFLHQQEFSIWPPSWVSLHIWVTMKHMEMALDIDSPTLQQLNFSQWPHKGVGPTRMQSQSHHSTYAWVLYNFFTRFKCF